MNNFLGEQTELYEKSLKIARLIYQNEKPKKKDSSLITTIRRSYREVLGNQAKTKENPAKEPPKPNPTPPQSNPKSSAPSPIPSYKHYLSQSIEESNQNIRLSRAGKRNIRYSSNAKPSAKTLNPAEFIEKPLPHVSVVDGKISPPLNLPFFREYTHTGEVKNEIEDAALEGLNRCEKTLQNFYKNLAGLEIFCSSNPGVPWNNDKRVLHRLCDNPGYKAAIIRNYNEGLLGGRNRSAVSRISIMQKKYSSSHSSIDSSPKGQRVSSPGIENKLELIQELPRAKTPAIDQPEIILERCLTRFSNTKYKECQKLVDIFAALKKKRPWFLRQKWEFIMKDSSGYKNKLDTLMKFKRIKKEVNSRQEKRLRKNKDQEKIYFGLLEVLKGKEGVKDIEIGFVNFLKNVLEEGWLISKELVSRVMDKLSKEDKEDLRNLVRVLEEMI